MVGGAVQSQVQQQQEFAVLPGPGAEYTSLSTVIKERPGVLRLLESIPLVSKSQRPTNHPIDNWSGARIAPYAAVI